MKKNIEITIPSAGAFESEKDPRAYVHENSYDKADILPTDYKIDYKPSQVKHQHKIGICTAEALIQLAERYYNKPFSDDFQYLAQKKERDGNWIEGSSLSAALWVAKNIGFLPQEELPRILDINPEITYEEYVAKLQAISNEEYNRLKAIAAKHKIAGYAIINEKDRYAVAKAIIDSKAGLYCRYEVTTDWYTDINGNITWDYNKISPIRKLGKFLSGHAISSTAYDFSAAEMYGHYNTWGTLYGRGGYIETNNATVDMKEGWIIYWDSVPENVKPNRVVYQFNNDLKYGQSSNEVKYLQLFLIQKGLLGAGLATGYYGDLTAKAVLSYQRSKNMLFTSGKIVGTVTRYFINKETK